jgi:hypothetical protein
LRPVLKVGDNHLFDFTADIPRQNHPGFTEGYLDIARYCSNPKISVKACAL